MGEDVTIRAMVPDEARMAVDWAAEEGWNPGLHDAALYYGADPAGFLVGLRGEAPIGVISAVRYDERFGFLGFYIVKPAFRGQGYGMRLWQAALAHLDGCLIGLDGVVAQQDNYRKSGFELAYRNVRYEGRGGADSNVPSQVVELAAVPFAEIRDYDRPFFPAARPGFLRGWVAQPEAHALGFVVDDRLAGYGVIRRCRSGYKVGPLYADTPEVAEVLFTALAARAPEGAPVFLDVPEVNGGALALAERHRMQVVFETARMYTGPAPQLPLERIFGVTSFEIG